MSKLRFGCLFFAALLLQGCELGLVNLGKKGSGTADAKVSPQAYSYVKSYTETIFQENKTLKNFKFQVLVKAYGHDHLNSSVIIGNLFQNGQTYAVLSYTKPGQILYTEIRMKELDQWVVVDHHETLIKHETPLNKVVLFQDLDNDGIKEMRIAKVRKIHPPGIEYENLKLLDRQLKNL